MSAMAADRKKVQWLRLRVHDEDRTYDLEVLVPALFKTKKSGRVEVVSLSPPEAMPSDYMWDDWRKVVV